MAGRQKERDKNGLILPSDLEFFDVFQNFQAGTDIDLTPENISTILKSAATGEARDQVALFNLLEDKENEIKGLMQTRINSVLGKNWNIVGNSNDAKNRDIENILQQADILKFIQNNLHGNFYGYNGSLIKWTPKSGGSSIDGFEQIDTTRWSFDVYGTIFLSNGDDERKIYSTPKYKEAEFNTDEFLSIEEKNAITFFNCNMRGGIPSNNGIFRSLIWQFFYKFFMMKNRMRTIEQFGTPFVTAKIDKQDFADDVTLAKVQDSIENLGANGSGVFTSDTDLSTLTINQGINSADLGSAMKEINDAYARLILGQTASSGDSSGLSGGDAQSAVRDDILQADCRAMENLINNQVLKKLEYNKYNSMDMRFVIDSHKKAEIAPQISAFKDLNALLTNSGKSVSVDYIIDTLGIPVVDNKSSNSIEDVPVASPAPSADLDLSKLGLTDLKKNFKNKLISLK